MPDHSIYSMDYTYLIFIVPALYFSAPPGKYSAPLQMHWLCRTILYSQWVCGHNRPYCIYPNTLMYQSMHAFAFPTLEFILYCTHLVVRVLAPKVCSPTLIQGN